MTDLLTLSSQITNQLELVPTQQHLKMPPKNQMLPKKDNSNKPFSFEEVAALLASSNVTIGATQYKVMAKIDKSRSESGYEHLFRAVKTRANEIRAMIDNGQIEGMAAKAPVKRSTISASPAKASAKANGGANGEKKGAKRG